MTRGMLLVTGASGFLGAAVVQEGVRQGWHVRALLRTPTLDTYGQAGAAYREEVRSGRIEEAIGTLDDEPSLRRACQGVAAVVHTAGLAHVFGKAAADAARFSRVNEVGTANLMRAAADAGVHRAVLASSVSVYGASADGHACDEQTSCRPRTPYAASKLAGERRASEIADATGMSLAILRFATIYGEGDRGNVSKLVSALRRGRFVWPGSGQNRKSLVYREDAAAACLRALDAPEDGVSVYNIAAPPVTMQQIVAAVCLALDRPVPRLRIPETLLHAAAAAGKRLGDPGGFSRRVQTFLHDDVYPAAAFTVATGFVPGTTLQEGMRRQVQAAQAGAFEAVRTRNDLPPSA